MRRELGHWVATVLSALGLLLFVVNTWLVASNAELKRDIAQRQAIISRGEALEELTKKIGDTLGEIGNKYHDEKLCEMLRAESVPIGGKCGEPVIVDGRKTSGNAADR